MGDDPTYAPGMDRKGNWLTILDTISSTCSPPYALRAVVITLNEIASNSSGHASEIDPSRTRDSAVSTEGARIVDRIAKRIA